jgi:hypothetical protein
MVTSEHTLYAVDEAPSLEAYQNCLMEPEFQAMTSIQTSEIKLAVPVEEAMKLVMKEA